LNELPAPRRSVPTRGNAWHDGTIIEAVPDRTWGTYRTTFQTDEGLARQALADSMERYNRSCILERHGYRSPEEVHASAAITKVEAA